MHILIVKFGALGDVVRTSYFAEQLKKKYKDLRLSWLTSPAASDLLKFNPYIDDVWVDFKSCNECEFDIVYSLDDELETVKKVSKLKTYKVIGASLDRASMSIKYDESVAPWFDMGLHSRHGKEAADALKRKNELTHAQIFTGIFNVEYPKPSFWSDPKLSYGLGLVNRPHLIVGLNPYAGGRWPSKELKDSELRNLIRGLFSADGILGSHGMLVLIGAGEDRGKNLKLAEELGNEMIIVPNTDDSLFKLSSIIFELDFLITSDSLAMHLAIAQGKQFLAFFAPTSATEIDDFGLGVKIISTSSDYCSYASNADNSSITAKRILNELSVVLKK